MPLLPSSANVLPYIDAQPSDEALTAAQSLVQDELAPEHTTTLHPSMPATREGVPSGLLKSEYARLAAGTAKEPGTGIDPSRYEALDAPAAGDLSAWKSTLQSAYTSAEYLRGRELNLGLLEIYGKNAWLIGNSQLEDVLRDVEREVESAKLELEAVEQARRAAQSNVAGEMQSLDETWRKGVGRMIEAQAASEGLKMEILNAKRMAARFYSPTNIDSPEHAGSLEEIKTTEHVHDHRKNRNKILKTSQPMSRSAIDRKQRSATAKMHPEVLESLKRISGTKLRASLTQLSAKLPSVKSDDEGEDEEDLRPCQMQYLAPSTANRLFRRSANCNRALHDEPIFVEHAVNTRKYEVSVVPSSPPSTAYSDVRSSPARSSDSKSTVHTEEDDRNALLHSINSERALENVKPLKLDKKLSQDLKHYVQHLRQHQFQQISKQAAMERVNVTSQPTTTLYTTTSSTDGSRSARLVSPPGLGALACGSLWAAGKYKMPMDVTPPSSPGGGSTHSSVTRRTDDPRTVFDTLVDAEWVTVGISRSEDGCWVIDLIGRPKLPVWTAQDAAEMEERLKRAERPPVLPMPLYLEHSRASSGVLPLHERRVSLETVGSLYSRM